VAPGDDSTIERMSDLEALMWALQSDQHLSSNFANISFLDRAPDIDLLRRRMLRASHTYPRLRRRIVAGAGPLNPAWVDDPDFDVGNHIREVTLPAGSTEADACALAAEIESRPFDPEHPLWEFTVVHGLPEDRAAMVQKLHHTITDGEGGIRMSLEFIDLERNAPDPGTVEPPPAADPPSRPSELADLLVRTAGGTMRQVQERIAEAVDQARHPTQLAATLAELPGESAAMARSIVRQFGVIGSHLSPLWDERSLERSLLVFDVSLDDVREAAHRLGGSVNDLFVAAAAGGAGEYHRDRGVDVDELRMSMPVSTRTGSDGGGNAFAPTRVTVPVWADPRRRFDEVHRRLSTTKSEPSMGLFAALAGAGRLVPRPVLVRLARQQVMTVDFTTSNLRAAPFDLFIAGALIEHNYPLGPVMGTAWNLTTMSYRGRMDLGLHVDTRAVQDPAALVAAIQRSFDELISL
jgi:diacylglycerol O-acyltransferase